MKPRSLALAILLTAWLVACRTTSEPVPSTSPGAPPTATARAQPPQEITPAPPEVTRLRIWVPPRFDPAADTPQGALLRTRLDEYLDRNPDVQIEVRVKAETGAGGLLSTLSAAAAAAPRALPDLVALPRADLETAGLRGLLYPLDGLTSALSHEDWYGYARSLASLDTANFGLPFAGDALLLVYRPTVIGEPPRDTEAALGIREPLAFPANSPEALFPLTLYLANKGSLEDEEGRPILDVGPLTTTYEFFQSGARTGLTPVWLTQYEEDGLAYQAFLENRAHLVMTWISTYLADPPDDAAPATLPTPDGEPFTLATGWLWALANPDPDTRPQSARLAEFLTEPEFLGRLTAAAGYLPTRSQALESWPDSAFRGLVGQLSESAQTIPPGNQLSIIGPVIRAGTLQVLKGQAEAPMAAQTAAQSLNPP